MASRKRAYADNPLPSDARPRLLSFLDASVPLFRSAARGPPRRAVAQVGMNFFFSPPSVNEARVSSEVSLCPRLWRKCLHFADADL